MLDQQTCRHHARFVDRLSVENHAVALDDVAATREFTHVVAVDVVGGWRGEPSVEQLGQEGVVDVRVDGVGGQDETCIDRQLVGRLDGSAFAIVECSKVDARHSGLGDPFEYGLQRCCNRFGRGDPLAEIRLDDLTGEPLEFDRGDPPSLTDHAVDGSVRSRSRCSYDRCDVEDLAPTDRFVASGLTQDVSVTGQQRERIGKKQPDGTGRSGRQCLGAEHAHLHRMLARSDVGDVGPSAGDIVIE